MAQVIRRGILIKFYPATYTADVLLLEATSTQLQGMQIATSIDGTSAISGAFCAVLLFDEHNLSDGCVIAVYPNGSGTIPTPPPGRVVFVTGTNQLNSSVIASGATTVAVMTGGNIPAGVLGVVFKAFFSSPTVGAYIQIAPHNGDLAANASIGNIAVANQTVNGMGLVPVDANGAIDIKANAGACTVTLYTYGYIM